MTDFSNARIVFHLENKTIGLAIFLCEFLLQLLGIGNHGAELIHFERAAMQSDTRL